MTQLAGPTTSARPPRLVLRAAGLLGSMSRIASSVDSTLVESFWSKMQRELFDTGTWAGTEQLSAATGTKPGKTPGGGTPVGFARPCGLAAPLPAIRQSVNTPLECGLIR